MEMQMPPDDNHEAALVLLDRLTDMLTELPDNSADTCISLRPCLPPLYDLSGPHPERGQRVIRLLSEIDRVLRPRGTLWLCHSGCDGLETVFAERWRAGLHLVLVVPDLISREPEVPPDCDVRITEHLTLRWRGKGGRYDRHVFFDSLRAGATPYDGPDWGDETNNQVVSVERLARACILSSTRPGGMVLDLAGESDPVYEAAGALGRSYVGVSAFTEPPAADGSNSRIVLGL